MRRAAAILLPVLAAVSIAAAANDPAEQLRDPRQEARARTLFQEVRCLVCQNESIDDSDADLAADLRRVVRAQVAAGRSDAEIKRYLVDRYGEFVLLRPPFSIGNAVLWLAPFGLVAGVGLVLILRRRAPSDTPPLTAEEEARLLDMNGPGSASEAPHEKQSGLAEAEAETIGVRGGGT